MLYVLAGKYAFLRKVIASAVALVFFTSYCLTDASSVVEFAEEIPFDLPQEESFAGRYAKLDPETFTIPAHLGEVKYSSKGTADKMIIHIQDAHCNYFAQNKISDIIEYLNTEYGVDVINLEGGSGEYDLSVFTSITGDEIRREVAEYFVRKGEVNGAEFFAINNAEKVTLWGIEDKDLYLENLKVYRDSLTYKEEVDGYLKELTHIFNNFKRHMFVPELLDIVMKYNAYKAGNLSFREYLDYILLTARREAIQIRKFPNIYLISQAMEEEGNIDFKKANRERGILIDELKNRLSKDEMRDLISMTVQFKTKRLSRKAYYGYLLKKSREVGLDKNKFPALSSYIVYVSLFEAVDSAKVMEEIDELEAKLKEPLFRNDEERRLDVLSKNLALTQNIFDITLTKSDYRYYLDNKDAFKVNDYLIFIEKEAPKYKITARPDENISRLDDYLFRISKFFEYSFKRDDAFLRNMRLGRVMEGSESAIMMTGGFHTENLCDLFKEEGISYVSILPKFTSETDYESPYFELLAGQTTDLQRMLSSVIAQAAMLQVASMLNEGLRQDAWSEWGVDAFEGSVIMLAMAKKFGVNIAVEDEEGNLVVAMSPDGEVFTSRSAISDRFPTFRITGDQLADRTAHKNRINADIAEVMEGRKGSFTAMDPEASEVQEAINFLEEKAEDLRAKGGVQNLETARQLTKAAEALRRVAANGRVMLLTGLESPIKGHPGSRDGGSIYINEGMTKEGSDRVSTIIHEAVAMFAFSDDTSDAVEQWYLAEQRADESLSEIEQTAVIELARGDVMRDTAIGEEDTSELDMIIMDVAQKIKITKGELDQIKSKAWGIKIAAKERRISPARAAMEKLKGRKIVPAEKAPMVAEIIDEKLKERSKSRASDDKKLPDLDEALATAGVNLDQLKQDPSTEAWRRAFGVVAGRDIDDLTYAQLQDEYKLLVDIFFPAVQQIVEPLSVETGAFGYGIAGAQAMASSDGRMVYSFNSHEDPENSFRVKDLGEGGFGVVYAARMRDRVNNTEKDAAVKIFFPISFDVLAQRARGYAEEMVGKGELVQEEVEGYVKEYVKNYLQRGMDNLREVLFMKYLEGQGLGGLIAGAVDSGSYEVDGQRYNYITMEHGGEDLASFWSSISGSPEKDRYTVSIMRQIDRIVAALHKSGVFHNDIKKGNFLVTMDEGGNPRVRIADFGLATFSPDGKGVKLSIFQGTMEYASDEVHESNIYGEANDMHALAQLKHYLVFDGAYYDALTDDEVGEVMAEVQGKEAEIKAEIMASNPGITAEEFEKKVREKMSSVRTTMLSERIHNKYRADYGGIKAQREKGKERLFKAEHTSPYELYKADMGRWIARQMERGERQDDEGNLITPITSPDESLDEFNALTRSLPERLLGYLTDFDKKYITAMLADASNYDTDQILEELKDTFTEDAWGRLEEYFNRFPSGEREQMIVFYRIFTASPDLTAADVADYGAMSNYSDESSVKKSDLLNAFMVENLQIDLFEVLQRMADLSVKVEGINTAASAVDAEQHIWKRVHKRAQSPENIRALRLAMQVKEAGEAMSDETRALLRAVLEEEPAEGEEREAMEVSEESSYRAEELRQEIGAEEASDQLVNMLNLEGMLEELSEDFNDFDYINRLSLMRDSPERRPVNKDQYMLYLMAEGHGLTLNEILNLPEDARKVYLAKVDGFLGSMTKERIEKATKLGVEYRNIDSELLNLLFILQAEPHVSPGKTTEERLRDLEKAMVVFRMVDEFEMKEIDGANAKFMNLIPTLTMVLNRIDEAYLKDEMEGIIRGEFLEGVEKEIAEVKRIEVVTTLEVDEEAVREAAERPGQGTIPLLKWIVKKLFYRGAESTFDEWYQGKGPVIEEAIFTFFPVLCAGLNAPLWILGVFAGIFVGLHYFNAPGETRTRAERWRDVRAAAKVSAFVVLAQVAFAFGMRNSSSNIALLIPFLAWVIASYFHNYVNKVLRGEASEKSLLARAGGFFAGMAIIAMLLGGQAGASELPTAPGLAERAPAIETKVEEEVRAEVDERDSWLDMYGGTTARIAGRVGAIAAVLFVVFGSSSAMAAEAAPAALTTSMPVGLVALLTNPVTWVGVALVLGLLTIGAIGSRVRARRRAPPVAERVVATEEERGVEGLVSRLTAKSENEKLQEANPGAVGSKADEQHLKYIEEKQQLADELLKLLEENPEVTLSLTDAQISSILFDINLISQFWFERGPGGVTSKIAEKNKALISLARVLRSNTTPLNQDNVNGILESLWRIESSKGLDRTSQARTQISEGIKVMAEVLLRTLTSRDQKAVLTGTKISFKDGFKIAVMDRRTGQYKEETVDPVSTLISAITGEEAQETVGIIASILDMIVYYNPNLTVVVSAKISAIIDKNIEAATANREYKASLEGRMKDIGKAAYDSLWDTFEEKAMASIDRKYKDDAERSRMKERVRKMLEVMRERNETADRMLANMSDEQIRGHIGLMLKVILRESGEMDADYLAKLDPAVFEEEGRVTEPANFDQWLIYLLYRGHDGTFATLDALERSDPKGKKDLIELQSRVIETMAGSSVQGDAEVLQKAVLKSTSLDDVVKGELRDVAVELMTFYDAGGIVDLRRSVMDNTIILSGAFSGRLKIGRMIVIADQIKKWREIDGENIDVLISMTAQAVDKFAYDLSDEIAKVPQAEWDTIMREIMEVRRIADEKEKAKAKDKKSAHRRPGMEVTGYSMAQLEQMQAEGTEITSSPAVSTALSRGLRAEDSLLSQMASNPSYAGSLRGLTGTAKGIGVRVIATDLGMETEALSFINDQGELIILLNSNSGISDDYLKDENSDAFAQMVRHEFIEAEYNETAGTAGAVGLSHTDLKRAEVEENGNDARTALNILTLKHMKANRMLAEMLALKPVHASDPNGLYYDMVVGAMNDLAKDMDVKDIMVILNQMDALELGLLLNVLEEKGTAPELLGLVEAALEAKHSGEIFKLIRQDTVTVVALPISSEQRIFTEGDLTKERQRVLRLFRDYGFNVGVVFYGVDDNGEVTDSFDSLAQAIDKSMQKEADRVIKKTGGEREETMSKARFVIAAVNKGEHDRINSELSTRLTEEKNAGVFQVDKSLIEEFNERNASVRRLVALGHGLAERDRAMGEEERAASLERALVEMLKSISYNKDAFEGENAKEIIERLLNGQIVCQIKPLTGEIQQLMEADQEVLRSL